MRSRTSERVHPEPTKIVTVLARLVSAFGQEHEVAHLLMEYGERVRDEPGNLMFAPRVSANDPREFWVYEEYVDVTAFGRHLESPHNNAFNAAVARHLSTGAAEVLELHSLKESGGHHD